MRSLSQKLDALCKTQPFETFFVFENLKQEEQNSALIDRHGDRIVESGSTRKIQIMMLVLHHVHQKKVNFADLITVTKQDQKQTRLSSGILHAFQPGIQLTIYDLLVCMISVSDNTAVYILGNLVGGVKAFNEYSKQISLTRTHHWFVAPPLNDQEGCKTIHTVTCARDIAKLLRLILEGTSNMHAASKLGVDSSLCKIALDILFLQKLNTALPYLLDPKLVRVAHKTGSAVDTKNCSLHMFADVGMVFDKNRNPLFLLVVFTDQVPKNINGFPGQSIAHLHIAQIAYICYQYVSQIHSSFLLQGISLTM